MVAARSTSTMFPPTCVFVPKRPDGGARSCVGIAGDEASATQLGAIEPAHGIDAAVRLLEVIARRGRTARARDILAAEGDAPFRSALADLLIEDVSPSGKRSRAVIQSDRIGCETDRLRAASVLPSATPTPRRSSALAEAASGAGAIGIRAAAGPRADVYRTYGNGGVRFRQCRRKSWLHCRCRRSAPAYRRLCRRADLFVGAHCRARAGAAGRWDRGVASRWLAPDSHFRLRQGLRSRRQRGAYDCRLA